MVTFIQLEQVLGITYIIFVNFRTQFLWSKSYKENSVPSPHWLKWLLTTQLSYLTKHMKVMYLLLLQSREFLMEEIMEEETDLDPNTCT
jgi:hypothetical protein